MIGCAIINAVIISDVGILRQIFQKNKCSNVNEVDIISLTGMILKGRYCVLEQVGYGGEGSLYIARDMELGVYRAVKELPIEGKREAKLLRLLEHPAIPAMVDYTEKEDHCYLVMEYIKGKSLGQWLREGRCFSGREILEFALAAADVLTYFHSRRPPVYYGDLKPDNLMLSETGQLYLVDYGSAVFGYRRQQRTVMGTRGFAAPEQSEGVLDAGSDVYALGKTIWALAGSRKTRTKLLCSYPRLVFFLGKCRRKDSRLRFSSMEQAGTELQRILYGVPPARTRKIWLSGIFLILTGILLMTHSRKEERDFYEALTEATEIYLRDDFYRGDGETRRKACCRAEKKLMSLLEEFSGKEEQKKVLLLLAQTGELGGDQKKAERYFEQLLFSHRDYEEGWAQYGLYLLQQGCEEKSAGLWEEYRKSQSISGNAGGSDGKIQVSESRTVNLWEEKIYAWRKK